MRFSSNRETPERASIRKLRRSTLSLANTCLLTAGCAVVTNGKPRDSVSEDPSVVAPAPTASAPGTTTPMERPSPGLVGVPDPKFHDVIVEVPTQTPTTGSGGTVSVPTDPTPQTGYSIDGTCYPACVSDGGGPEGWGWENSATCVVHGSLAAGRGAPCGEAPNASNNGFQVDGKCYPACTEGSTDSQGWGWENDESCIGAGSPVAQSSASCGGSSGSGGSGTGGSSQGPGGNSSVGSGSCPSTFLCPSGTQCGCYLVPGLGARKSAILSEGAEPYMLASAMMETEKMTTDYAYGDGKWGDSFNAGVTKQNWFMMRHCHAPWSNLSANDYSVAAAVNGQLNLDVKVYSECRAFYGGKWWAAHRNGQSGVDNPNTFDIQRFRDVMDWTHQMIGTAHQHDDVRFWVYVPAI